MVKIDSGAPEPSDKFQETPRNRWRLLLNAKRTFLAVKLAYDCRCLIEFCEEAEIVYEELGYASAEEMIREGYELEPSQVSLAVAWLKANGSQEAISLKAVQAKVAEAREKPLAEHRRPTKEERDDKGNNITFMNRGTGTSYTLRRLARDAPEMLDRIEAGELSVNQAAIQAGIRRKATPEQVCLKAFGKAEHRLQTLKAIIDTLSNTERIVVQEWLSVAE